MHTDWFVAAAGTVCCSSRVSRTMTPYELILASKIALISLFSSARVYPILRERGGLDGRRLLQTSPV